MNSRSEKPWREVPAYWVYPQELFNTVHSFFVGGGTFRGMSREADAVMHILRERADPEKVFIRQLKNESAEVRSAAVTQLREYVEKPGVVAALVAVISDTDDPVRAAAIHTLNGYFQGASPSKLTLLPSSAAATKRVLEGDLLELILSAAGDPDVAVRSAAMYVIGNSQDPRVTQAIVAGLKDADLAVRGSAAAAAGTQPADAVAALLMKLVDDEQTGAAACRSLGQLKYEPAIPKLKELAAQKRGMTADAAIAALQEMRAMSDLDAALAKLERNRAIPVLEQYLDNEKLWRIAATGLWNVGTPEAITALKARLAAENYARTEEVLTSLMDYAAYQAQVGGEEVRKSLVERMAELLRGLQTSANPATRKAAADHLKLFPAE